MNPQAAVNLTLLGEQHPMEQISIPRVIADARVQLDLFDNETLLIGPLVLSGFNSSWITIESGINDIKLVISRIDADSDVVVTFAYERIVTVMASDPVLFLALMVAAVLPFAAGLIRLRTIRSRLQDRPLIIVPRDEPTPFGPEVE